MVRKGYDYAWQRPNLGQLRSDGGDFVIRYVSWDTHGKNMTKTEVTALGKAGFQVVTNWEYNERSMMAGWDRGVVEAHAAISQGMAAGMPTNRPVYYSADWNVEDSDLHNIEMYLRGAATVHGGPHNVGLYSNARALDFAWRNNLCGFLWQAAGWRHGDWDGQANIRQTDTGVVVAGATVDVDQAVTADFGQWDPPGAVKVPPFMGRYLRFTPPNGYTEGHDVEIWQARMAERGWRIDVDGVYGPQSAGVCRQFQAEKRLLIDGVVGPITWYAAWETPVT